MFRDFFESIRKIVARFFSDRVLVLAVFLLPFLITVIIRLFQLQIVRGTEYYENYVNTTKKEVSISAMRGNIYDRSGKLLAGNRVVYSVAVSDEDYYTKSDGAFNEMLLRLIRLLERYDVEIVKTVPVVLNDAGLYEYSGTEAKVRRFIRDVYGTEKIEELAEEGIDAYAYDAETVMQKLLTLYNFTKKWQGSESITKADALKIGHIRYALSATAYTRYISTVVAPDVTPEIQAAVLESQAELYGVNVEESYERVYYDSECFSTILGYVGSITTEEIEELNAQGGDYIAGDVIGKEGVESAYESYLQGIKGKKEIYVNSTGMILDEKIIDEPVQGNDLYLSIDADTTVAAYNVVKQQLAGIIVNHLYSGTDYDPEVAYEKSEYLIPIRDVYFQMINNDIVSIKAYADESASDAEKHMENMRALKKQTVIAEIASYLNEHSARKLYLMDEYTQTYIRYLYTYLKEKNYIKGSAIDTSDEMYVDWKNGDTSFPDFLIYALKNGWADMSAIGDEDRYNSVEVCYDELCRILIDHISEDYGEFDKLIYSELIHTDVISGCDVGLSLFSQGILEADETYENLLSSGDNDTAFDFFEAKITSMEISPSQIALDPCSAGVVLTNPNNGELLAVVSYPGYDANRINDAAYYNRLLTDLSSPLYSRATQSRLAPGSTFKMVTATAAMEGGYLQTDETILCEGIYDKLDHPRCWIYRQLNSQHGDMDVIHALGQSCNCFFYECGYRFSTNENGQYSPALGISIINNYASLYGFGKLTGIECAENVSVLTNELPVTSAIGQGTNAFTTISLARYTTAIASNGNVYECKLLSRIEDRNGNVILSYTPQIESRLDFADSTWERIHQGMYTVVHEGGSRNGDFDALRYDYAAKSGSAQENLLRAEHGWYVTYGPYDDIQYAMAVQIPNGYTSGNAAQIACGVYEYLEGDITLAEILENSAANGSVNDVSD